MTYGEQYYVNIFLKDNTEFWVPYAKTNFIYQKQKPKGLRDGKLIRGNLKYNAGKLSYKYKVRKNVFYIFFTLQLFLTVWNIFRLYAFLSFLLNT